MKILVLSDTHGRLDKAYEVCEKLPNIDLIIHCGACMFNRKHVLSRIERARQQQVPITNYGVILAALTGILEHVAVNPAAQAFPPPCSA